MNVDMGHIRRAVVFACALGMTMLIAPTPTTAQGNGRLLVFAASSLTNAFLAIETAFEAQYPDTDIILNFAGSSTLATQITQGAPADVFASANAVQMTRVETEGLLGGHSRPFARNRLIVITPLANEASITSLADLTNDALNIVIASQGVPIRAYTEDVLTNLSAEYGEAYPAQVLANVVSEEDNVRRVSLKVTLGEADAGFVYASDVTADIQAQVNVIEIPPEHNRIASYPIAPIRNGNNRQDADAFIAFVLSDEGQTLLATHGLMSAFIPKTPLSIVNQ